MFISILKLVVVRLTIISKQKLLTQMAAAHHRRAQLRGNCAICDRCCHLCSSWSHQHCHCCSSLCNTFYFTIAWILANIAPLIMSAVWIHNMEKYSLCQDGEYCGLYDNSCYYNSNSRKLKMKLQGKCNQLGWMFGIMLGLSLSYG